MAGYQARHFGATPISIPWGTLYRMRFQHRRWRGPVPISAPRLIPQVIAAVVIAALVLPTAMLAATPPPLRRPFPAPVTSRTVSVPASIDSTGQRDASGALNRFIESVPDRSIIAFKAGGMYRLDRGLFISSRHHLVFDGQGATLRAHGPTTLIASSPFLLDGGNTDIVIRGFVIQGGNLRTGPDIYHPGEEDAQGIAIYGGARIEIAGNSISQTHGDGIYANEKDTTHSWVDGLWIHDNQLSRIGRMGVTFNAVAHGMVERNRLDQIGMFVFDIEPDTSAQGARGVTFRNNTVGTYGLTPLYTNWFFASANYNVAPGAVIVGITISGNRVTGGAASHANTPNAGGLATWIGRSRVRNVKFLNNTTTKPGRGPVLVFEHVDGLTVSGNVQPLLGGPLARISDSTGVVTSDGDPVGILAILAVTILALGIGRVVSRGPTTPPAAGRATASQARFPERQFGHRGQLGLAGGERGSRSGRVGFERRRSGA